MATVQVQRHSPLATAISRAVIQLQESRAQAHDCKGYDCATCSLHLGEVAQLVEDHISAGIGHTASRAAGTRTIEQQLCDRVPVGVGPTAARVECIVFKREDDGSTQALIGGIATVGAQNLIDLGASIAIRKAHALFIDNHDGEDVIADLDRLAAEVR